MTITQDGLGAFGSLARALGIVGSSAANAAWFGDPMGGSTSNPNGLKTVLADDGQRQALVDFVDEVLGPPEEHQVEGQQWVPLFRETDPDLVVYAVLEPVPGAVRIGVAAEYATGDEAPCAKVSVHVPIFQVPRTGTDSRTAGAGLPKWLFLGQREARIEFGVEATFTDDPPVSGQAHLGGARARVGIPTLVPGDSVDFALTPPRPAARPVRRLDLTDPVRRLTRRGSAPRSSSSSSACCASSSPRSTSPTTPCGTSPGWPASSASPTSPTCPPSRSPTCPTAA